MGSPMLKPVALIGVALVFRACSDTTIRDGKIGSTLALYTTADIHVVTERPHPTQPGHTVICTEANPDVAKALSTASQLSSRAARGPEVAVILHWLRRLQSWRDAPRRCSGFGTDCQRDKASFYIVVQQDSIVRNDHDQNTNTHRGNKIG
jgi:hypothetical protein